MHTASMDRPMGTYPVGFHVSSFSMRSAGAGWNDERLRPLHSPRSAEPQAAVGPMTNAAYAACVGCGFDAWEPPEGGTDGPAASHSGSKAAGPNRPAVPSASLSFFETSSLDSRLPLQDRIEELGRSDPR